MSALPQPLFHYRPMRPEDLDAVAAVEQDIYTHPWTRGNFAASLVAGHCAWVVEAAEGLAAYGVVMVGAGEAHLLNFNIARALQGRGLGRQLLAFFENRARELECRTMLLEVRRSNARARELYSRAGFHELTVRRNYYPAEGGREDAILMGKDL